MLKLFNQLKLIFGLKEYLFTLFIVLLLLFNSWPNIYYYLFFGLLFIFIISFIYGQWLFPQNSLLVRLIIGLIVCLAIIGFTGTLAYYLYKIDLNVYYLQIFCLTLPLFIYFLKKTLEIKLFNEEFKLNFFNHFLNIPFNLSYLGLVGYLFYLITQAQTAISLRSPWEVIDKNFFLLYFLATLILVAKVYLNKKDNLILICLHFFLSFSIAFFVYQIGYSYDSFIHRRNELTLWETGTLSPKTFYYIGQYSQLLFLNKLLGLPLVVLDKLYLPLLAALTLPVVIITAFKESFNIEKNLINLLPLAFLMLTFTNFIVTTPQGLANLFSLLIIILSLHYIHEPAKPLWLLFFLALVTMTIHPLTGLPLLFFVILLTYYLRFEKKIYLPQILRKSIFLELIAVFLLALPTAFLANSLTSSEMKVGLNQNFLKNLFGFFSNFEFNLFYRPFITIYDLIYTYANNLYLLLGILTIYGLIFIILYKKTRQYLIYLITFLILIINYFFLANFFEFKALIYYERYNYTQRILELAWYFLIPFFLIAFYQILKNLVKQKPIFSLLIFIIFSLAITVSLYLSYPRFDPIKEDHGYSTSLSDIKTVIFLENLNKSKDYVVLAAQPVSAAAIQEFGFKKYYQGYFFYPVPTGNKLYEYYLEIAYDKRNSREIIEDVGDLTKVKTIYLVINDYWWAAEDIISKQKNTADDWYSIDGKNYIFKYEL